MTPAGRAAKRLLDVGLGLMALALVSPALPALFLIVRARMGRPVLFRQLRCGYQGTPFTMYKFRTMRDAYDSSGQPLPDSERLTAIGRLLRATSLDELPELINVLKGDMSLVGPRPLLLEYLPLYNDRQQHRHDVRPGITGWAQINGRNSLDWERRLELDVWYVEHQSIRLDVLILLQTVRSVLTRRGVTASGHATMPKFQGSRS